MELKGEGGYERVLREVCLPDKPITWRGMLSALCSLFDPLGLVAPVIFIDCQIDLAESLSQEVRLG